MKVASEEREAENKEFQTAVTEQRAAQDVLSKALARLEVFYKGGPSAKAPSLVQQVLSGDATPGAAAPPEPKGFDKMENNRGAKGVMQMIQNIIDVAAQADRRAALEDAERLQATNADIHANCDFLLKNFEVRQAARTQELEALAEAKAVFSGADFS